MIYPVRIIIAGGRDFTNYQLMKEEFHEFCQGISAPDGSDYSYDDACIISGMARGADKLGIKLADELGIQTAKYPARWQQYGSSAGYIRNDEMASNGTHLLAFHDGSSRGTAHMINRAKAKSLDVTIVRY